MRLWKLGDNYRTIELLLEVPVAGFVNGLAFSADATRLVVACGQEHRLGRWWRCKEAQNGVLVVALVRDETIVPPVPAAAAVEEEEDSKEGKVAKVPKVPKTKKSKRS